MMMMIKLSTMDSDPRELWLNTSAISSVIQPSGQEQDMEIGAKIFITGEENCPWLVRESVREVIDLIERASR